MTTTVTVLAGERTIGGTQILVEDRGARLLFDCGLVYDPAHDPRGQVGDSGLAGLLARGLVPAVPGLYDPRYLPAQVPVHAVPPLEGPLAVALSHAHLDHAHLAGCVAPEVPVLCSPATARLVQMLDTLGRTLAPPGRGYAVPQAGNSFAVGQMRVHMLDVDHDLCGACGMLIETDDGLIAYSGDLRLHGAHPEQTLAFAAAARAAGARLLILEGTRLRPPAQPEEVPVVLHEEQVAPRVAATLHRARGRLGVILLTPENGERVEALARAMQDIGRLLVLDPEGAALATAALGRSLTAPYAIYTPESVTRRLQEETTAAQAPLLAAITDAPARLTARQIAGDPGRFLVRLPWTSFADVRALSADTPGTMLFHADGVPLGPFDPAWLELARWEAALHLEHVAVGSSGHATPPDLTIIAREVDAGTVMCVHSLYPERLETGGAALLLPVRGRRYDLAYRSAYCCRPAQTDVEAAHASPPAPDNRAGTAAPDEGAPRPQ